MRPAIGTRRVFIEFCVRDGMRRSDAEYEFDNHLIIGGHVRLKDSYLTMFRVGAPFSINRTRRAEIYASFENAQNHASFENVSAG